MADELKVVPKSAEPLVGFYGVNVVRQKTYRCPKGHEWVSYGADFEITGHDGKKYGPFCFDCVGAFMERLFGKVAQVTETTGADGRRDGPGGN